MDADEWLQIGYRFPPRHFSRKIAKPLPLPGLQDRKGLDHAIAQRGKKIRRTLLHRLQDIAREIPMMRALLDYCKIIPAPPDLALPRAVVTQLRMIERLLHEPGEGDWTCLSDRPPNDAGQSLIPCGHRYVYY
jgi:hypothetical protein